MNVVVPVQTEDVVFDWVGEMMPAPVAKLEFDQALRGTEQRLTITRQARCETCAGAGTLRGPGSSCTQRASLSRR